MYHTSSKFIVFIEVDSGNVCSNFRYNIWFYLKNYGKNFPVYNQWKERLQSHSSKTAKINITAKL